MSFNFQINSFNITTSLTDFSVYIRVLNNVSCQCYENNINIRELNLPFSKEQVYSILNKCFMKKPNYEVIFLIKNDVLNLTFNILLEGLYKLNFNVILKEKILSNDSELTLNINQIDIKYAEKVKDLEDKVKNLENLEDKIKDLENIINNLSESYITYPNNQMLKLNIKEIIMSNIPNNYYLNHGIKYLCKLEIFNINQDHNISSIKLLNLPHNNLKTLQIGNVVSLKSLEGIEEMYPNLETVEFHQNLYITFEFFHYLKKLNKLKSIKFVNCAQSQNKDSLIEYCKNNNINIIQR